MEIRGQELEAAATAGGDATCRAAGKEGLIRDIPRQLGRGFPSAARLRAAPSRGVGSPYPDHETPNNLSADLTTTSTGKPPPSPSPCGKLDTNAKHQNAHIQNILHEICCVGQPSIAPPVPHHQATNPARPAKQKLPNRPNLSEPQSNQYLRTQSRSRPQQRQRDPRARHVVRLP